MKNRKTFVLTFVCILTLALLQSCDDSVTELEKLPPATQSGKGIFGCLVDGKAWVSESAFGASAYYQTGTLFTHSGLDNKYFSSLIQLHIEDLDLKESTYYLSERTLTSNDARYYDHDTSCEYVTTSLYVGKIVITHLDKVKFIVSGTFEFEAYSTDCSKVIKVTEGRFDIHYAP